MSQPRRSVRFQKSPSEISEDSKSDTHSIGSFNSDIFDGTPVNKKQSLRPRISTPQPEPGRRKSQRQVPPKNYREDSPIGTCDAINSTTTSIHKLEISKTTKTKKPVVLLEKLNEEVHSEKSDTEIFESNKENNTRKRFTRSQAVPKPLHVVRNEQNVNIQASSKRICKNNQNTQQLDQSSTSDPEFKVSDSDSESESSSENDSHYESSSSSGQQYEVPAKGRRKASNVCRTPKRSLCTPSMKQRLDKIVKPTTPLQQARVKLHVGYVPSSLPCRGEEFNSIFNFLHGRLSNHTGGCMYVSGVPGTGKTATVNEVLKCLRKLVADKKLDEFKYIDINGLKLSEPRQAYVRIYKQLEGEKKSWEEAQSLLQKRFTKKNTNKKMTLILADELDMLCNKRQDVIYNLLDWPSHSGAKLLVITIANTMDLPERSLMGRVTSRLGLTRLTFCPYTFKELEQIVSARLEKIKDVFKSDAIQFVSRKVAAVSGDARRALDICRRSAEIAEKSNHEIVTLKDVNQALTEMIANPKVQAIKSCSLMEQYFLRSIVAEVTRIGVEEVLFKDVYTKLKELSHLEGVPIPNVSEALAICARLSSWRLIICDHSKMNLFQRILLNVSTDDIHYATLKINDD